MNKARGKGWLVASVLALAVPPAAQAGVVYTWQPTVIGSIGAFSARLEMTDAAYAAGGTDERYGSMGGTDASSTGLVSFEMRRAGGGSGLAVDFTRPTSTALALARLTVRPDGTLSGRLEVDHGGVEWHAISTAGLWRLLEFSSVLLPGGGVCGHTPDADACTDRGYWMLDPGSTDAKVPVPATLALLAFGAAWLLGRRRTTP